MSRALRYSTWRQCAGLSAMAFCLSAFQMHPQSTFRRGWALNADGSLKIMGDAGSLKIIGWDRDSVDVTGTIGANVTPFGGGTKQGVKLGVETMIGKAASPSDLVIHVPSRARVWIRSVSADISISSFAGALDATTVAGHVQVQGSPAEVRAETMNGSLDVSASPAYLRLKTATGNVTWTGSSEDVGIITVSGRVVINAGTVQRARFESIDGEIRFSGGLARATEVAIDTHSGNVVLAFNKGTNAVLEVSAPGAELFGTTEGRERGAKSAPLSKSFYRSIGHPAALGQSVVVRTYKGYVSVVMQ